MAKFTSYESSFLFSIHRYHHKSDDIVVLIPIVAAIAFTIIGAPVISVLCSLPLWLNIVLFVVPIPLVTLILFLRKKIIFDNLLREKNVENKVEISICGPTDFAGADPERIMMFENSANMPAILYNWFNRMGVLKSDHLKMSRVIYDNYAPSYLAVSIDDLQISEAVRAEFNEETFQCTRLCDVNEKGQTVNTRIISRVLAKQQGEKK